MLQYNMKPVTHYDMISLLHKGFWTQYTEEDIELLYRIFIFNFPDKINYCEFLVDHFDHTLFEGIKCYGGYSVETMYKEVCYAWFKRQFDSDNCPQYEPFRKSLDEIMDELFKKLDKNKRDAELLPGTGVQALHEVEPVGFWKRIINKLKKK